MHSNTSKTVGNTETRTAERDFPLPSVYQICFVPLAERLSPDIQLSSN